MPACINELFGVGTRTAFWLKNDEDDREPRYLFTVWATTFDMRMGGS